MRLGVAALALLLAGCGGSGPLTSARGQSLPPTPLGVETPPTPEQMLVPPPQAAPERADDPVKRAEERREDRFDLPPTR